VKSLRILFLSIVTICTLLSSVAYADTLDSVLERGFVRCGATQGHQGFSNLSADGFWSGYDVDLCRAISAAVFGDANRVEFIEYEGTSRAAPLQGDQVDLFARNAYWTMSRDTQYNLHYVGITYFDGQAIMVPEAKGVVSAVSLQDVTVCAVEGSIESDRIEKYFFEHQINYTETYYEELSDLQTAYMAGLCDVVTAPASHLQSLLLSEAIDPAAHRILPERLSVEPWGPVVRAGDDRWQNVVRWTLFALLNAEELGVNSRNVETMVESKNPKVRRLLGVDGQFGEPLGIPDSWAHDVIKGVGNFGEIFSRNLGKDSGLNIIRGNNELWTRGGLMYAPPIR